MAVDYNKWIYTKTATPYMDSYNALANKYKAQRETDVAAINERQNTDLNKSNAQYDNTAKQNYINYMQAQKKLPSQLNALGIRGGASESSAIRLNTNYGSNVASNEAARNTAAESIRQAYAQQIADYDKDLNERLAQAEATARQNQITFEREQMDKDLERFSGVIEGLYTNKKGYKNLIKQLQASNDPNKEYKIMLARRAMNMLKGSGGGGGGGRSYGGGGYGGYSSYSNSNGNDGGNNGNGKIKVNAKAAYKSGAAQAKSAQNKVGTSKSSTKSATTRRHGGRSNSATNWWKRYTR